MTNPACDLSINSLELHVHLGWPEDERINMQKVLLDINIIFPDIPAACETDKLEDTFCYAQLINAIHKHAAAKHFFLIEHLSAEIYQFIKKEISKPARVNLRLTKFPAVKGLGNGVSFSYGDAC